jgi:hypothetical protein
MRCRLRRCNPNDLFLSALATLIALIPCAAAAEATKPATNQAAATQATRDRASLAVLPLDANLQKPKDAGAMLAQVLATRLSAQGDYTVVDRADLEAVLEEQELRLAGLVDPDPQKAAEVGKLIGADLLITGRIVENDNQRYAFCKAISVDTSELKGFFITLDADAPLPQIAQTLHHRLKKELPGWARTLIPEAERGPTLVERLASLLDKRVKPKVAVVVTEQHRNVEAIDPAVETELTRILGQAGVSLVAVPEPTRKAILDGSKDYTSLSRKLNGARYLIRGEAFSENAGQVKGLTVAAARAELEIIDLKKGTLVAGDAATTRIPDLANHLAAKSALQTAAQRLAKKMFPDWARHLPETNQ